MGIDLDTDDQSAAPTHLVFAYYVTGHGLGHATRVVEVVRHLVLAGHDVHVVTAAPDYVFKAEIQSPKLHLRKVLLDSGAVQSDALTVDRVASLEKYHETAVVPRNSILKTEAEWLISIKADLVVSDVFPVACRAAADAGIRSVCVTNFSWDFIYAEYVMVAGQHHRSIIWQIAEDYSHCEFVIRLPGYCPMPAFRDVIDVPLVVRRPCKSRKQVREELGVGDDEKLLIVNFGGQPGGWKFKDEFLPAGWKGLICGASESDELGSSFIKLTKDAYTPDIIAASDCMLGKIGYGTVSEALACKLPFIFVRRDYFNEEPFLRNLVEYYQSGVEMKRRDFLTGHWKPYIEHAVRLKPSYEGSLNGGEVTAGILQDTALGKNYVSDKSSGARRLRDAIVLGFQLQRTSGSDISVPAWYAQAEVELGLRSGTPKFAANGSVVSPSSLHTEDFDIIHGDLQDLSDTKSFLKSLAELAVCDPGKNTENHQLREQRAAEKLFNWEDEVFVARAPGRLDVMGGIADYSGSLVLQMPIKEACHVAIQMNHPGKQRLWKHVEARQQDRGQGQTPVLQIVSYGAELSNRDPTFDMNLSDFMEGDKPISYEKARKYFAQDPSQKWAAYIAGTILVLMTELGVRFQNSIGMLVSSAVPEGKGVSSSASVEVASMSAIAAAQGLNISPRDLALLCQKVENHVVGAPCGVMDQMASACGEANKLLAMVCQPAEVLGLVDIPGHMRFWGMDSGIRHSVGGADYGSVRVGAFMGRKMIKCQASEGLSPPSTDDQTHALRLENGSNLLEAEANLDYLCNLPPHRYDAAYGNLLPNSLSGEAFVSKYVDHGDPVTTINPNLVYDVKASTRHPIYENFRVKAFKALLTSAVSDDQLISLGELMYQCHYSYSACGLGSDGTDRIVNLVQETQHNSSKPDKTALYGAKITGGGSGGTVCILSKNSLLGNQQVLEIQRRYKEATGHTPFLFEGSSPGAGKFGYLKIRLASHKKVESSINMSS